ncbi:MAG: hypothetical protein JKX69_00315 [Rhodobacteraceae bacterium]|nr:hypothetical protein [Paracoccaceae bacterium]
MLWRRRGLCIAPPKGCDWWVSHAQAATPLVLGPRHWRIFLGGRDGQNHSRVVWVDVDPLDNMRELGRCDGPVLELGPPGSFDSAGQCGSSLVVADNGKTISLYYVGMHLRADVPYGLGVGLALSHDGGATFTRSGNAPVIGTGPDDPWFSSVAFVERAAGGYLGWYMSGTGWISPEPQKHDPVYGLVNARSDDGVHWLRSGGQIMPGKDNGGLTRPWVAQIGDRRRLFYSHRAALGFRAGGAAGYRLMQVPLEANALTITQPEPVLFENPAQPEAWDHEMQCYASVVPHEIGYVMFYNGNGFGNNGLGWATITGDATQKP